jgi:hypothetical protein
VEPKESVGHLIGHFFEDLTHFDGKFFVTVKDLLIRPGFLTLEYVDGRRVTYLNPIRMYIFISAVFFVALFAGSEEPPHQKEDQTHAVNVFRQRMADSLRAVKTDSLRAVRTDSLRRAINNSIAARLDSASKQSGGESITLHQSSSGIVVIDIEENKYNSLREFDSIQRKLPDSAREKGTMRWIIRHNIRQKVKLGGQSEMHIEVNIQHDIPKIMFLLLPLFALYVGWFYSRKKYYYVNHLIFSVHFHSFVFLFFLFLLLVNAFIPGDLTGLYLALLSPIPVFIYLIAALHGMYQQSWWVSLWKGLAIALIYLITASVASTLLMLSTFFRI